MATTTLSADTAISIAKADLMRATALLSRVVERRNTIPILSNIRLSVGAGEFEMTATDLDIEVRTRVPCEPGPIGSTRAVTLPASTLNDIARKVAADAQISIGWDAATTSASIRAGRSRFTLPALPESDFPDITTGELPHRFSLAAKQFLTLIDSVEFAISTEETRYYLNGIYIHTLDVEGQPRLRAVATDGHRLSRFEMPAPEGSVGMPGVIIPRKAVGELARLAKDHDGDLLIELSSTKIRATAGEAALTSKLIDGTFPDYQRVIPAGNDKLATLEREAFQRAVDRVATISSERGRAVKLALSEGALTLSVTNPDSGSATEELAPDYAGPSIDIGFNHRYLLDILGILGGDTVQMKLSDPGAPAVFQKCEGDSLLIVLMPMRV